MNVCKVMCIFGLAFCATSRLSAQGPGCAPGMPCGGASVAPSNGCQNETTSCVKVKGPKKCCKWNQLLERLAVHEHCYVQVQRPACATACAPTCAPACAPRAHGCKCKSNPCGCGQASCAPACGQVNPYLSPIPSATPAYGSLPAGGMTAVQPMEPVVVAASFDPTIKFLEAMQASQAADAKAFQQLMEKRIATMTALRAMQDNDIKALAQLETLVHQTRLGMAPAAKSPVKTPMTTALPRVAPDTSDE